MTVISRYSFFMFLAKARQDWQQWLASNGLWNAVLLTFVSWIGLFEIAAFALKVFGIPETAKNILYGWDFLMFMLCAFYACAASVKIIFTGKNSLTFLMCLIFTMVLLVVFHGALHGLNLNLG